MPSFPVIAAMLVAPLSLGAQPSRFEVTVAPAAHAGLLTGRLVVAVAKAAEPEALGAGRPAVVDDGASSYPMRLAELPAGDAADTPWIEHVSIQRDRLTRFRGRPIHVQATVLLPSR